MRRAMALSTTRLNRSAPLLIDFGMQELAEGENPLGAAAGMVRQREAGGEAVLRWGIARLHKRALTVEMCVAEGNAIGLAPDIEKGETAPQPRGSVAFVIPTGVGACTGGFIGDAGPCSRALEFVSGMLILHPNVANGADLYGAGERSLYVDGLVLDRFFAGNATLGEPGTRRVGLLLDMLEGEQEDAALNAANASRAVLGVDVIGHVVCDEPVAANVSRTALGHFSGRVENPGVLLEAADRLLQAGAEAIAVVTGAHGIPTGAWIEHYTKGGPNPVGSLEALISRAIAAETGVPCAHAPAFIEGVGRANGVVDPRAAAEVISHSGLPCILRGLSSAPGMRPDGHRVHELSAIVVPYGCAGGAPALAATRYRIPLVAVRSNECLIGVSPEPLDVPKLCVVENHAEAVAFVVSQQAGVPFDLLTEVPSASRRL
jgi:hypothetical protein